MTAKEESGNFRVNESTSRWISTFLVAGMIACGAMTIGSVVHQLLPTWQPWILGIVCFFIALDGLYTRWRFKESIDF